MQLSCHERVTTGIFMGVTTTQDLILTIHQYRGKTVTYMYGQANGAAMAEYI